MGIWEGGSRRVPTFREVVGDAPWAGSGDFFSEGMPFGVVWRGSQKETHCVCVGSPILTQIQLLYPRI